MRQKLIEALESEGPVLARILLRDRKQRVASQVFVLLILLSLGKLEMAAIVAVALIGYEVLLSVVAFPAIPEDETEGSLRAAWSVVLTFFHLAAIGYAVHTVLDEASAALMSLCIIWTFAIMVFTSHTYAALSVTRWTILIPPFVLAIDLTLVGTQRIYLPGTTFEVVVAVIGLMHFFFQTYQLMRSQAKTNLALEEARKAAQDRLEEVRDQSLRDPLTQLMNRAAFDQTLSDCLSDDAPEHACAAVFLIDLDDFKPINDSYSHAAGDAILQVTAQRLLAAFRSSDCVARLGGDEFAVAANTVDSPETALRIARKIVEVISAPITYETRTLSVGCSIGIALSTSSGTTPAQLLNQADQAMFRAKADKTDSVACYNETDYPVRLTLDDRVRLLAAIESGEIRPHYQPKVDMRTGAICGMEALARWHPPGADMIMPGTFIPMIKELSLQNQFLLKSIELTLVDIDRFLAAGVVPGQVSVNLTEETLATSSTSDAVLDLLAAHPAAMPFLTFEVTEDIFIARAGSQIKETIKRFRRMGIRISLDDFGTGFASFQHLRELEFDELKIDTSFVRSLGADAEGDFLVKALVDISYGLQVDVIAEGVETEAQKVGLLDMGCHRAQGFLFSKAVPFDVICADLAAAQMRETASDSAA